MRGVSGQRAAHPPSHAARGGAAREAGVWPGPSPSPNPDPDLNPSPNPNPYPNPNPNIYPNPNPYPNQEEMASVSSRMQRVVENTNRLLGTKRSL